jgi:hypothetical protein
MESITSRVSGQDQRDWLDERLLDGEDDWRSVLVSCSGAAGVVELS